MRRKISFENLHVDLLKQLRTYLWSTLARDYFKTINFVVKSFESRLSSAIGFIVLICGVLTINSSTAYPVNFDAIYNKSFLEICADSCSKISLSGLSLTLTS